MLIRLCVCADWSAPLLFAYGIRHIFAWPGPRWSCMVVKHCRLLWLAQEFIEALEGLITSSVLTSNFISSCILLTSSLLTSDFGLLTSNFLLLTSYFQLLTSKVRSVRSDEIRSPSRSSIVVGLIYSLGLRYCQNKALLRDIVYGPILFFICQNVYPQNFNV